MLIWVVSAMMHVYVKDVLVVLICILPSFFPKQIYNNVCEHNIINRRVIYRCSIVSYVLDVPVGMYSVLVCVCGA